MTDDCKGNEHICKDSKTLGKISATNDGVGFKGTGVGL